MVDSSYLCSIPEGLVAEHPGVIDKHPSRSGCACLGFNQSRVSESPDVHGGHTAACGRSRQQIDSAFGFDQMIHFRFEWIVS